jgi:CotH kinase protein
MTARAPRRRPRLLAGQATLVALASFLVGGLCSPRARADCDDPFADPNELVDLQLQLSTASWQALQESAPVSDAPNGAAPGCEDQYPYFEAQFRCGDAEPWLTIGVRRKRDRTETRFKLPLKLDFNRSVTGQRWPAAKGALGFRRLTLNSGQPDEGANGDGGNGAPPRGVQSALLTEHLAWRLMRQALPEASGSAYARLALHFSDTGETRYQGLYILLEDIDRTTVRARYGVDEGALYKTTDANCPAEAVFEDPEPNSAREAFDTWLGLDPRDFVGSWYARTDQAIDLNGLLRQEALRELLLNTEDTILGRMNNFYALDLNGRRRLYLPWDLDDMFRPEPQARPADTPFVASCVGNGGTCAELPVGVNIRDNAEVRPVYLEQMCELSNTIASEAKLLEQLDAIDALIRPELAKEVPLLWQAAGLDPLDERTRGTYAAEVLRMRDFLPQRLRAVRALIEAEGVDCPEAAAAGAESAEVAGCGCQLPASDRARNSGWFWVAVGLLLRRRSQGPL